MAVATYICLVSVRSGVSMRSRARACGGLVCVGVMLLIASPVSASGTDGWSPPEVSATVPTRTQQPQWLSALSAPDGTDAVMWYEPIDSSTTQDNLYVAMRPSGTGDWTLLDPGVVPSDYLSFLA